MERLQPNNRAIETTATSHGHGSASIYFDGDLTKCDAITDLLMKCQVALTKARNGLILDLTKVEVADTKLIAALVIVRRWASSVNVELVLKLPRCVQRWLAVCRLESLAGECD